MLTCLMAITQPDYLHLVVVRHQVCFSHWDLTITFGDGRRKKIEMQINLLPEDLF